MNWMWSLLIWQEKKEVKTLAISRPCWLKGALAVVGAWWQQNPVRRAVGNGRNGLTEKVSWGEGPGPVEEKQQRGKDGCSDGAKEWRVEWKKRCRLEQLHNGMTVRCYGNRKWFTRGFLKACFPRDGFWSFRLLQVRHVSEVTLSFNLRIRPLTTDIQYLFTLVKFEPWA